LAPIALLGPSIMYMSFLFFGITPPASNPLDTPANAPPVAVAPLSLPSAL
jgi:hypothetical protein